MLGDSRQVIDGIVIGAWEHTGKLFAYALLCTIGGDALWKRLLFNALQAKVEYAL